MDFPAPVSPTKATVSPASDAHRHVAQHRPGRVVAEGDVVKLDLAVDRRKGRGVGPLADRRLGAEQLAQLHDRRAALLVGVVELHQRLDGGEERGEEEKEGGQLTDADAAVGGHGATHAEQGRLGADPDELGAGGVDRVGPRGLDRGIAVLTDNVAVHGQVDGPAVVGRDDPDAGK